jgi:hypothetical protein
MITERERRPTSASTMNGKRSIQVIAGSAVESHAVAVLPSDDPKAVVLDLVQPEPAGWRLSGFCEKARRDEAGRESMRIEHGAAIGTARLRDKRLRLSRAFQTSPGSASDLASLFLIFAPLNTG